MLKARPIRRRAAGAVGALGSGVAPVLARLYAARGITDAAELELALCGLVPVSRLDGVEAAAALVADRVEAGERIVVIGDFDADGATSTALLVRVLRQAGADVHFRVPDRARHGYGLSPELVRETKPLGARLVVTVDSGINCHAGVALARALGMDVLVTDHHLPGERLPAASAVVNPNLPGQAFSSRCLAGVGVAFYLAAALLRRLGRDAAAAAALLDLVALGTVADLVPLDRNNRILVEQGLRRIRAGAALPGIEALLRAGGRDPRDAVAGDLGFAAGPRLNAAGRLHDMSLGIECLLADDPAAARELAGRLSRLNEDRKRIEARMQAEAVAAVSGYEPVAGALPVAICVSGAGWHPGVVGLVASRLKERFHRPAAAFALDAGGRLKGSVRSVPGLHVRDALAGVDVARPGLIERFGGHAMAAGLTLRADGLDEFREAFTAAVLRQLDADGLDGALLSDGELAEHEIDLPTAELLRRAGPWGQGFPEPLFDGRFRVIDARVVGEDHLQLRLRPAPGERTVEAIAFRQADRLAGLRPEHLRVAYRLGVNEYNGMRRPQLVVEYFEPA